MSIPRLDHALKVHVLYLCDNVQCIKLLNVNIRLDHV